MKICVLASGSSGNCTFVELEGVRFLVDAGISAKRVVEGLRDIDERIEDIEGILLTHEHSDHIAGVHRLLDKFHLRLYSNRETFRRLHLTVRSGQWIELTREALSIGPVQIHPFAVNHDAADPFGYRLANSHTSVGVITDLGSVTNLVREQLAGVTALVIEANYDHQMLINGPYPWDLKQRIASRLGHLSNTDCGTLLVDQIHDGLRKIFLAHRSEHNNDPILSLDTVQKILSEANVDAPPISISHQRKLSDLWVG